MVGVDPHVGHGFLAGPGAAGNTCGRAWVEEFCSYTGQVPRRSPSSVKTAGGIGVSKVLGMVAVEFCFNAYPLQKGRLRTGILPVPVRGTYHARELANDSVPALLGNPMLEKISAQVTHDPLNPFVDCTLDRQRYRVFLTRCTSSHYIMKADVLPSDALTPTRCIGCEFLVNEDEDETRVAEYAYSRFPSTTTTSKVMNDECANVEPLLLCNTTPKNRSWS
jgi:hypothetical protein